MSSHKHDLPTTEPTVEQSGLMLISALINFVDWLDTQGVLVSNQPEPRASRLRAKLVKDFLAAHSEGENYLMQAEQIAEILGEAVKQ